MKAQTINENIRFEKPKSEEDFKDTLNIGISQKIFNKTGKPFIEGGVYSYIAYGEKNWKNIIKWLLKEGYTLKEIEEILRSKLMRWAADQSHNEYGNITLKDFLKFNNIKTYKGKTQINDFLDEYINENIRFHKSQSEEDFKDTLFNKPLPFEKVRPGDIAIDYVGEEGIVVDKIDSKKSNNKELTLFFNKYSTTGWSIEDFRDDIDTFNKFIAIKDTHNTNRTEIYTYDESGAIAYRYSS